jgi:eukaryotic-like serine/threonine-protein kinase
MARALHGTAVIMTAPQRILGEKYRLIRPIEQGGMGSVWLAEHLSLASPVAVKLIATELAASEEGQQRFLHEAHAAALLRSPHVVQTLDYGVDAGTPYIVMELLLGESLADRLARRGRLGATETELVLRHIGRAVAHAHELGIVHRDLKPANIFITRNEDEEIIKLFDFGIAKAMPTYGSDGGPPSSAGSFVGTPAYMSPEQLQRRGQRDLRVDIWAMGVVAYECLLGRPPFVGAGLGDLVLAICSEPLPVPSQHAAVPEGFDAWFARACARDPEERFASAREAAHELRRALEPALEASAAEPAAQRDEHLALPALATERWPAPASTTGAASSATIRRPRQRYGALLFAPIALLALWMVQHGVRRLAERPEDVRLQLEPSASALVAAGPASAVQPASLASAPRPATSQPRSQNAPPVRERAARTARASPRKASLSITSTPPSSVLIDGVPRGSTPLHSVQVRPGSHRVTLIYQKQRKSLLVKSAAGENTLLSARFLEATE